MDVAADVALLVERIERVHPRPFRHVTRRRFHAEAERLAARAPRVTHNELLVDLMRLVALLGPRNGHTGIFPLDPGHGSAPVRTAAFARRLAHADKRLAVEPDIAVEPRTEDFLAGRDPVLDAALDAGARGGRPARRARERD